MVFSKALGGWGQDWSRENSNLALWSPHLLGWLSPQELLQPLPSTPTAGPPSSFPSPSRGVVTGQAAIGGNLGPETHGLLAQCGAGALQPVGRQDLKPSHPRQRSSSWAGSSVSWKPVAVGGREDVRGLSRGSHPLPMSASSHLSFGHFFDRFDPLRGLVSHIIFRGLCSGICLVRARP